MSDNSIPQKQCPRCKQSFPLTKEYFRVCRREKNGFTHACRECLRKQDAAYLEKNRDKNKERCKQRRIDRPEYYKQYDKEHAGAIRLWKQEWRKNNPDKVKKHKRDSNKRHRDSHNIRIKRYNEKHPDIRRMRGRVDAMKRRVKEGDVSRTILHELYDEQNGKCAYCGISIYWEIPNDIHVDHIKAVTKGGTNDKDNLNLTCADCNLSKHDLELSDWLLIRGW